VPYHRSPRARFTTALCAAAIALALNGCKQSIDLTAVRNLANAATTSETAFDGLAQDYYDSCERRIVYQSIGLAMESNFPSGPQPGGEKTKQAKPPPISDTRHQCDRELAASRAWQQANGIVVGYFVALGNLAGNAPGSGNDTYGAKALAADIAATQALSSARAAAIGTFANDVIGQVYDAKRRGAHSSSPKPMLRSATRSRRSSCSRPTTMPGPWTANVRPPTSSFSGICRWRSTANRPPMC